MTRTIIFTFLSLVVFSCGHESAKHKVDSRAVQLNYAAAALVPFIENDDSCRKALMLLDSATNIDSNYFLGYYNKLMFFSQLKRYDKAVATINRLIDLRPNAHDLHLTGGLLFEKMGDTIRALQYLERSLSLCNAVLDTMSQDHKDYKMLDDNKKYLVQAIYRLGHR